VADDTIVLVGPDTPAPEPTAPETPPPSPAEQKLAAIERQLQQMALRNAALEASVDTMQRLQQPAPVPPQEPPGPPPRPRTQDFSDQAVYDAAMEQWLDSRAEYRATQRVDELQRQQQRQAQEAALQQDEHTRRQAIAQREQALRAEHADYDRRFQQVAQQASPALYAGLQQAGAHGPDLLLYLHAHPEELTRLNQVPPHEMAYALGQLVPQALPRPAEEAVPPVVAVLPAAAAGSPEPAVPPARTGPLPTVTAGGTVPPSGFHADMTQRQYEAERRKQNPRLFRR